MDDQELYDAQPVAPTTYAKKMDGWIQMYIICSLTTLVLIALVAIVALVVMFFYAAEVIEDEEDTLILEGRCVFFSVCEEMIGNVYGPTAADFYCGGAGAALAKCGLTSSASGISSSILDQLLGSPASPQSSSESAWIPPSAWY